MAAAAERAVDRIAAKQAGGIAADAFAEIGEALFWLYALGAHGRTSGLAQGLLFARNQCAHGNLVSQFTEWQYGAELGRLVLGRTRLGTRSAYLWRRNLQTQTVSTRSASQREAYRNHFAGQPVVDTLRAELVRLHELSRR
ncbi:MAG: hypothetical protein ABI323_03750 [Solirubrobacteraceae bacterium]